MNKKELIKSLKLTRDSYSNEDRFRGGVRTGLGIALGVIDKLDEPEKIVVPKFIAEWYEKNKKDLEYEIYAISNHISNRDYSTLTEMEVWFNDNTNKPAETLIKMKLFGYEVEKEKLYYVKLPNTNSKSESLYLAQGSVSGDCWFNSRPERLDYEGNACKHKFTEKEIKAIDERYCNFAVEAKE